MAYQSYLIAPYTEGLDKSVEPWLAPENAFMVLTNCFLHNGYVKKKFGYRLLGRLQSQVTGTASAGATVGPYTATLTTPVAPGTVKIYDGVTLDATDAGDGTFTESTTIDSGSINYATGEVTVTYKVAGTPSGIVTFNYDYYLMKPVMGILQREQNAINREVTTFFDATNAYEFNGTKFVTTTTANQTWTGTDYNFFYGCNYYYDSGNNKLLWVTNNKPYTKPLSDYQDGIKYYNGTSWATLRPLIGTATYLETCLCMVSFKGRLVTFRTQEESGPVTFYQRARWSQPNASPLGVSAWRSDLIGYGGYVDAATSEAIVGVEILGDRCLVYFERSLWELFYTGIKEQPFTFRKISDEYGCESTFSIVESKGISYALGLDGITVSDGNSVKRIDQKLDFDLYSIKNTSNAKSRIHGKVDDLYKMIYWTLPQINTFPTKLLAYNYENNSFSYFDDSFTTLGYYQPTSDYKWSTIGDKWSSIGMKWSDMVTEGDVNQLVAGNQQGFIEQFYFQTINDASLHITGFTVGTSTISIESANHNITANDGTDTYVKFINVTGITPTYAGSTVAWSILTFKVDSITDINNFVVGYPTRTDSTAANNVCTFVGTYAGGGTISRMFNFNITTKKFNPMIKEGSQLKIGYVDLYTNSTYRGQIELDVIVDDVDYEEPSSRFVKSITNFPTSNKYGQSNVSKQWNRGVINARGQFLQLKISLSEEQMLTSAYRDTVFELNGMNLWIDKAGKMIGLK